MNCQKAKRKKYVLIYFTISYIIYKDKKNQILVLVPGFDHILTTRFSPPYRLGCVCCSPQIHPSDTIIKSFINYVNFICVIL